jgi:hypothetical protein
MRTAATQPLDPGYVAAGLARLFPAHIQRDEHAMEAIGSLVGYLFHATDLELK